MTASAKFRDSLRRFHYPNEFMNIGPGDECARLGRSYNEPMQTRGVVQCLQVSREFVHYHRRQHVRTLTGQIEAEHGDVRLWIGERNGG